VDAQVFNAVITLPANRTTGGVQLNAGLYVQTGGRYINFVACAGGVDPRGYYWLVERATTSSNSTNINADSIVVLWTESGHDQPLSRDCTIVTNGQNLFEVYLDGKPVYTNHTMDLGYQYPLSARVEVQTTDGSTMRYARFSDFYATSSENVTVGGLPYGATVQLIGPSGSLYSSGVAGPSGIVSLDIAALQIPLTAFVTVTEQGRVVASSPSAIPVWPGDVYFVSPQPGA
jgi:hypothetical protein